MIPFKTINAVFETNDDGSAFIGFTLTKESVEAWRYLADNIPDNGELTRCVEIILETAREVACDNRARDYHDGQEGVV